MPFTMKSCTCRLHRERLLKEAGQHATKGQHVDKSGSRSVGDTTGRAVGTGHLPAEKEQSCEKDVENWFWTLGTICGGGAGNGIRSDITIRCDGVRARPGAMAGHAGCHDRLEPLWV